MTPRRRQGCQGLLAAVLLVTAYIRLWRPAAVVVHRDVDDEHERQPDLRPNYVSNGGAARRGPRTIVIGDVHGCIDELNRLLAAARYSAAMGDRVILLGDLINKGK